MLYNILLQMYHHSRLNMPLTEAFILHYAQKMFQKWNKKNKIITNWTWNVSYSGGLFWRDWCIYKHNFALNFNAISCLLVLYVVLYIHAIIIMPNVVSFIYILYYKLTVPFSQIPGINTVPAHQSLHWRSSDSWI